MFWSPHINKITKARQKLGFLKVNIHSVLKETKTAAYPTLEYCSYVWDPYTHRDIGKIEKVQRQAARFVNNNYRKSPGGVTDILKDLKWDSLERRGKYSKLTLFNKMI